MSAAYYRVGSYYVDTSTPSAPKLYRCITAGDKTSSVWALVAGGGVFADFWDPTVGYSAGAVVQVVSTVTYAGVKVLPGTYILRQGLNTSASPTGNQIPQYPYPTSGTIYWMNISMGIVIVSTCNGGTSSHEYVNASGTF